MEVVILGFFALIVAVVVSTPVLIALGFFVKTRRWSNSRKEAVFIGIGAFLVCPVLVPAGTIAAIPIPNWIAYGLLMWFDPSDFLTMPLWYAKAWHTHIPFLLASALLMTWIAKMVFFKPPTMINKNSEPLTPPSIG